MCVAKKNITKKWKNVEFLAFLSIYLQLGEVFFFTNLSFYTHVLLLYYQCSSSMSLNVPWLKCMFTKYDKSLILSFKKWSHSNSYIIVHKN